MSNKEIKLKGVSKFVGMNISANKIITLNVLIGYEEIVTSVQLLQGLNSNITVLAKLGIRKAKNLGMFTVNSVNFDRDGNAKVSLKSMVNNVELEHIMEIIGNEEEVLQLLFKAIIELPGEVVEGGEADDDEDEEEGLPFY